jgi:NAD(P)-dependent dehydrogenase (short-subunit alcohol dehydrogenase family)
VTHLRKMMLEELQRRNYAETTAAGTGVRVNVVAPGTTRARSHDPCT